MGKIKDWISDIGYWLSELSSVWTILIFGIVISVISWGVTEFFGKKYDKFYDNKSSCSWAVTQFKDICGKPMSNKDGDGIEYYEFYDSRGKAINDFYDIG